MRETVTTESKRRSYWADQTGDLRARLAAAVPAEELKRLHRRRPLLHFLVLGWQFLLLFGGGAIAWRASEWWIWLPAALVVGFTVFNFTVMLHEVVHELVFGASGHRRIPGAASPLRVPERDLGDPVHPLAPRSSRPARGCRGGPETALAVPEAQRPLVQGAVSDPGAHPDLFPGGAERDGRLSGRRPERHHPGAEADRGRPPGHPRRPHRRRRLLRGVQGLPGPGVPGVPRSPSL